MLTLVGTVAGRPVRFELAAGRHRVGRGPRNDLDLGHKSVSREHAQILVDRDRILVTDLGSRNGTWINGNRIADTAEVRSGDRLRFGAQEFDLQGAGLEAVAGGSASAELQHTVLALSDPNHLLTEERMTWEEASGDLSSGSVVNPALFQAVTESGNLLMLPRPLTETFDLLLGLVDKAITARRILLLLTDTPDGTPAVRAALPAPRPGDDEPLLSQTILGSVLKDRQALLVNDAQSDPRFKSQQSVIMQNLRSAMVAPLFDNKEVIGLLYADSDDPRVRFDRNQLKAFTLLANLIAVKVTNAHLLEAQRVKERMEQEVAAAAQVQRKLLASELPEVAGYELLARQIPCFEVAGDLYDVTPLRDGRIALVVGDVTGKGMGAALLMSNVLASLRVLYQECPAPADLADRLHRQLLRSSDDLHFVTLFLGLLDPVAHRLEYVNAGHNPPLLLCTGSGEAVELGPTGLPLGLIEGMTYKVGTIDLPPDCLLCVFSDGIPEAQVDQEFYGEERFIACVRQHQGKPLEEVVAAALDDLKSFLGEGMLDDDVTLLLARRRG